MNALLETKGLTKRFGGLLAVDDLDLSVAPGEIVGLIGPNGAGKTTVFAMISGFLPPSSGTVLFQGADITGMSAFRIARAGISRVFQQAITFEGLTVLDNVLVGLHKSHQAGLLSSVARSRRARTEEAALREKAVDILGFMGLAAVHDWEPANLPHGHQKALGMAVALASDPKLILLDEPATGMNPSESDTMIDHIRRVRDRGTTVVVVEHDMRVIKSVCDRLVCMNFGQKLCEGDPGYVTSHPEVCEAYLGKGATDAA